MLTVEKTKIKKKDAGTGQFLKKTNGLKLLSRLFNSLLKLLSSPVLVAVPQRLGPGDGDRVSLDCRSLAVLIGDGVVGEMVAGHVNVPRGGQGLEV